MAAFTIHVEPSAINYPIYFKVLPHRVSPLINNLEKYSPPLWASSSSYPRIDILNFNEFVLVRMQKNNFGNALTKDSNRLVDELTESMGEQAYLSPLHHLKNRLVFSFTSEAVRDDAINLLIADRAFNPFNLFEENSLSFSLIGYVNKVSCVTEVKDPIFTHLYIENNEVVSFPQPIYPDEHSKIFLLFQSIFPQASLKA